MLNQPPIGMDAIVALEFCAATISSCSTQTLDGILGRLLGIPANRRVLDAIGKGLNTFDPLVGTNPFFATSLVVPVLRAHAFSSPDVAVTYLVQGLNNFLQTAHAIDPTEDQNPDAFLAQTIDALSIITPSAQRNSQDRVRLSLLSLADLGARLPNTAERAQVALQKLAVPPMSTSPPNARSKIAGLLLGGIGLAGALGVILWSCKRRRSSSRRARVVGA